METSADTLEIEPDTNKPFDNMDIISGYRIVDLGYMFNWCLTLNDDHRKYCTAGRLELKKEIRKGNKLLLCYQ